MSDEGEDAVAMLATAVVLVLGGAFCAFIVLVVAENASSALIVSSAAIGSVLCLLGLLRGSSDDGSPRRSSIWKRLFRKKKRKSAYKVQKAAPQASNEEWGQNRPPTAESVRQLKEVNDGVRNWSPKSSDAAPETDP